MGLCLCKDDSDYDFQCDMCKKGFRRDQELFILPGQHEDFIVCSVACRDKLTVQMTTLSEESDPSTDHSTNFSFDDLIHTSQQQ